jgi:hypothetical protein
MRLDSGTRSFVVALAPRFDTKLAQAGCDSSDADVVFLGKRGCAHVVGVVSDNRRGELLLDS